MPPGNVFESLRFTTELYRSEATDVLAAFVPRKLRKALRAQTPRLDTILETGKMPLLGKGGGYRWMLAVWNFPLPLRVCLKVERVDHGRMTIAELLEVEQRATKGVRLSVRRLVQIIPGGTPNYEFEKRMWKNIKNGHHWSHGL